MIRGAMEGRPKPEAVENEFAACPEQQQLMEKVQQHLIRIGELSHAAADAVANRNDNLVIELDKQVENELGAKERSLSALRQHREEHGC